MDTPLGSLIRQHRLANGLTQAQLADELDVTVQSVCAWEANQKQPAPAMYPRLAKLFKIAPLELTRAADLDLRT